MDLLETRCQVGLSRRLYSTTKEEMEQPPVSQAARLRPTQVELGSSRLLGEVEEQVEETEEEVEEQVEETEKKISRWRRRC